MTQNIMKEIKEQIVNELALGTRESKIDLIIDLAGDEYETLQDAFRLAKLNDKQINKELLSLYQYYDEEEE